MPNVCPLLQFSALHSPRDRLCDCCGEEQMPIGFSILNSVDQRPLDLNFYAAPLKCRCRAVSRNPMTRIRRACPVQKIRRGAPKALLDAFDESASAQRLEPAYMSLDKRFGVVSCAHVAPRIRQVPIDTIEAIRSRERRDRAVGWSRPDGACSDFDDGAFRIVRHVAAVADELHCARAQDRPWRTRSRSNAKIAAFQP